MPLLWLAPKNDTIAVLCAPVCEHGSATSVRKVTGTTDPVTVEFALAVPAEGAFFCDDQLAIRQGAERDGFLLPGAAQTPGFTRIRQPAETVSVILGLSDGFLAVGSATGVQYGGVAGRDPVVDSTELARGLEERLATWLVGRSLGSMRSEMSGWADAGDDLGTAAAYGLSQALLMAEAHLQGHHLMALSICAAWDLPPVLDRVPVYAQTGESRYDNVDKMILKQVDALPHGLINDRALVGAGAGALIDYVTWVRDRIRQHAAPGYHPTLHLDVYGLLGLELGIGTPALTTAFGRLEAAAAPYHLRIEHPLDAGSRDAQIHELATLRGRLRESGIRVDLVADEYANTCEDIAAFNVAGAADMVQIKTPDLGGLDRTVEAVLDCHRHGVLANVGGSCVETDVSARATTHVAIATGADQLLAKPGMGVDEGLTIVRNEMARTIAVASRHPRSPVSPAYVAPDDLLTNPT